MITASRKGKFMAHPAIEQNRRLLQFYYIVARIVGLFFLAVGVGVVLLNLWLFSKTNGNQEPLKTAAIVSVLFRAFKYVFYALIAGGVAELIRCLFVNKYEPNWILRYGDKILYLYVTLLVGNCVYGYVCNVDIIGKSNIHYFVLITAIKVLVAIGLGLILKRIIMPIIKGARYQA